MTILEFVMSLKFVEVKDFMVIKASYLINADVFVIWFILCHLVSIVR